MASEFENAFINWSPIGKQAIKNRVKEEIRQQRGRSEGDFVGNPGVIAIPDDSMFVVPIGEEERQFGAFVDKVNLLIGLLLLDDHADPVLLKKQEIEPQMHGITFQATIKPNNVDGRKRRAELVEQLPGEARPHAPVFLLNGCVNRDFHRCPRTEARVFLR